MLPRVMAHMQDMPYVGQNGRTYKFGEFFPAELSPFAYNESLAQEYFPLGQAEALAKGYQWKEKTRSSYSPTIQLAELPDDIREVTDQVTQEIIPCLHGGKCPEQCASAFKILPAELQFYRQMNLPLPRLCPNCRYQRRFNLRNPLKLWHRHCACGAGSRVRGQGSGEGYQNTTKHAHGDQPCPNEFETSYAPERPEIVYC